MHCMASLLEGQESWALTEQKENLASWETRHIFYFALFQFPCSPQSFGPESARDATHGDPKCSSVVREVLTVFPTLEVLVFKSTAGKSIHAL